MMNETYLLNLGRPGLLLCCLLALALGGCGDDSGATDSGTLDSSTVDSSTVDSSTDSGTTTPCPATQPTDGDACTREGLACGYGDDPRTECRPVATCTSGMWSVVTPTCSTLPPATCPATREVAADMNCTPDGAICAYEGLACTCTNCIDGPVVMCSGAPSWHCDAPNSDPQCPAAIPRRGDSCTMEAQMCGYGCEAAMARTCTDGVWVESTSPGGCPVSTRRAKRDIHYLAPAEADAIAEQVTQTRLATWEYIDPALRGRRHLGFILEDQPGSFAEDPEARMVDLYGYTSMLVANAQAQQRRIDALERELGELRGRLSTAPSCTPPASLTRAP